MGSHGTSWGSVGPRVGSHGTSWDRVGPRLLPLQLPELVFDERLLLRSQLQLLCRNRRNFRHRRGRRNRRNDRNSRNRRKRRNRGHRAPCADHPTRSRALRSGKSLRAAQRRAPPAMARWRGPASAIASAIARVDRNGWERMGGRGVEEEDGGSRHGRKGWHGRRKEGRRRGRLTTTIISLYYCFYTLYLHLIFARGFRASYYDLLVERQTRLHVIITLHCYVFTICETIHTIYEQTIGREAGWCNIRITMSYY